MIEQIRREVNRSLAGVRSAVRAVLQGISLAQRIQRVNAEALAGESLEDLELMQHYGFTSAPPAGAQVIVLPLGGRTSAAVIVASEHGTYRFALSAQGEVALYNQFGCLMHFKADGSIRMLAPAGLAIVGDVAVTGTLTASTDVVGGGKSLKTHTHGGVTTGLGITGAPI